MQLEFDMAEGSGFKTTEQCCSRGTTLLRHLLSVPGGRLALFLFLLFSAVFSKEGHSVTSGPLEPLNCSGSLLDAGSKGRALSPRQKTQNATLPTEAAAPLRGTALESFKDKHVHICKEHFQNSWGQEKFYFWYLCQQRKWNSKPRGSLRGGEMQFFEWPLKSLKSQTWVDSLWPSCCLTLRKKTCSIYRNISQSSH